MLTPNLDAMSKAIDFIEDHLREPITIADVAGAVSYSLYHFSRLFNVTVHHTPYDYLMRRRLSASAAELLTTSKKIVDIAFEYQFQSAETYSRAFRRMFKQLPGKWRKQRPFTNYLMPRITMAHLRHRQPRSKLGPVLVERGRLHVTGIMARVEDYVNELPALWQSLSHIVTNEAASPAYGVFVMPPNDTLFYLAAVRSDTSLNQHMPLLVEKRLPSGRYAKFRHDGGADSRQLTMDYMLHTWLPQAGQNVPVQLIVEQFESGLPLSQKDVTEWDMLIPIGA